MTSSWWASFAFDLANADHFDLATWTGEAKRGFGYSDPIRDILTCGL